MISLHPLASYVGAIKPELPERAFEPARSRLGWLPVHALVIALGAFGMSRHVIPWFLWPLVSLAIGASFAGLAFLAHETLHGAVVRERHVRYWVGLVAFLPWTVRGKNATRQLADLLAGAEGTAR